MIKAENEKKKVKSNNGGKAGKIIYILTVVFLVALILLSLFLGIKLNEDFFRKYSEDKKLEKETIGKIHSLQIGLLIMELIFLMLLFLCMYFKKSIKLFINKHNAILQNFLLLLGVLISLFLIFEVSLGIIFYDKTTSHGFGPPTLKFNYKYIELNNEGFRDRDLEIEKKGKRIAVLGDSFTYGWGIKNPNNIYLKVLEKKLNLEDGYEVMNFGLGGMDTEDELNILKEKVLKYNPDMIIIGYLPNDMKNVDKSIIEYTWTKINLPLNFWLRNYLYTFFFLETQLNKFLESIGYKENFKNFTIETFKSEINREYNRKIFREIDDIGRERNISILIVVFPMAYNLKEYPFIVAHEFVLDIAKENNFYFLDLLEVYSRYDEKELVLNKYDIHINEFAHKLAGEAIFDKLKEEKLV